MRIGKVGVAAVVAVSFGTAAHAESGDKVFGGSVTPDAGYFIGYWGLGDPAECEDSDTMAFYSSGAWAVTNGGGNPVEAIGTWSFADGAVTVRWSELRQPKHDEAMIGPVSAVEPDQFAFDMSDAGEGVATLYRCE